MALSLKRTRDEVDDTVGPHILSCLRGSKHAFSNNIKMPWERCFKGPADVVKDVFRLPVPVRELAGTFVKFDDEGGSGDFAEVGSAFKKAGLKLVKTCDERLWVERLTAERKAAVRKWTSLIASEPAAWDVAIKFYSQGDMTYATGGLVQSIQDALAGKASSTLHSRVNPLCRLVKFCDEHGKRAFPVSEGVIYDYLKSDENFAPTYPRSLLISLSFARHVLGLRGDITSATTGRCKGVTHNFFIKKRRLLQRPALSVDQVVKLEKIVMNESAGVSDRIAAGFFCFTLYSRARYSDALSVVKLTQDIVLRDGIAAGFLEADASRSKTSTTLERKTRFLPLTSPVVSVARTDWVRTWMQLRRQEGLEAAEGFPLLPGPKEGGMWSKVPLTANSAAVWLRALLDGTEGPPLDKVGTHSLKATTLSWVSKFGVELSLRRALGYHQSNADRSVNTYARDAMAAPLRALQQVIDAIAEQQFFPDKTRSGMFADEGRRASAQNVQAELDESSSESSGDEEHHDFDQDEAAVDKLAGAWQVNKDMAWNRLAAVYFRHRSSRCIHVVQDEGGSEFMCGRRVSVHYVRMERKPEFLHPVCMTCERAVASNVP